MYIISQNSSVLINSADVSYMNADNDGRVFASLKGTERPRTLGGYDDARAAKHVLGLIAHSMADGVSVFQMPDQIEIRGELMNRKCAAVRRTGGGSSHGGT